MAVGRLPKGLICALAVLAGLIAVPTAAEAPELRMLEMLDAGQWDIRPRDSSRPAESLCMRAGRDLIQLRHPHKVCSQFVVEDKSSEVTVQYTCHGQGYGRTHIRRESDHLVQIETQGIAEGFPFDFAAEARRTGDCAS
jgi:hypothetical protein